jgi:hypothetical protein
VPDAPNDHSARVYAYAVHLSSSAACVVGEEGRAVKSRERGILEKSHRMSVLRLGRSRH